MRHRREQREHSVGQPNELRRERGHLFREQRFGERPVRRQVQIAEHGAAFVQPPVFLGDGLFYLHHQLALRPGAGRVRNHTRPGSLVGGVRESRFRARVVFHDYVVAIGTQGGDPFRGETDAVLTVLALSYAANSHDTAFRSPWTPGIPFNPNCSPPVR